MKKMSLMGWALCLLALSPYAQAVVEEFQGYNVISRYKLQEDKFETFENF